MTCIAQAHVVQALRTIEHMDAQAQLRLGDEVFAQQPNLLGSIVVLRRMGASDTQIGVAQQIAQHSEQHLLAFAYGHLRDSGVLAVKTEPEKYVMLAALNLVDCIAFAAPRTVR